MVNAESAGILTVLVFGAGTDYALLLVARYREELRRHADRHEAMAVALRRAGPAIVASAGTVVAGLLCLLAAETNSTRGLGPVAAIGVVVALAAMLTLLPALLVISGRWISGPPGRPSVRPSPPSQGCGRVSAAGSAAEPRRVWVGTALALGALAIGVAGLHADGLTEKQSFTGQVSSVIGEEVLARHFPAGAGSPVVVIADAAKTAQVQAALAATPGIAAVAPPVAGGGLVYLQGTLSSAPDSAAAYSTVERVRDAVHAVPGANAKVGGETAPSTWTCENAARHDREVIIPIILAGGVRHPGAAAAGAAGPGPAGGDGGAVLCGRPRGERAGVRPHLRRERL